MSSSYPVDRIGWHDVRAYLDAHGWKQRHGKRSDIAIFRHAEPTPAEVVVPLARDLKDYARAMLAAVEQIASVETRSVDAVVHDLLQPSKDTIRFAIHGDGMRGGTLNLDDGVGLLVGAKKALMASACTAKMPRRFHPRMSFADAEKYVEGCRLGQTEIGSYVVTVDAPHEIGPQLGTTEPFGRRASATLLRGLSSIATSVRAGDVNAILDDLTPAASANLCDAIIDMAPKNEDGDLRIASSWSPLIGPPSDVPSVVTIERDMYKGIEWLGQQLRPSTGPTDAVLAGYVIHLAGGPGPTGAVEGEVILDVTLPDDRVNIKTSLGPEAYRLAVEAHMNTRLFTVAGTLHRGLRGTAELREPRDFKVIGSTS